jgi:large subunit ribosomal protein L17
MVSLVEHGRIRTTLAKAKELRRHIEPVITLGKKGDVATRRLLLSRIPNEKTVAKIISQLSTGFKDRNGGYTRIIKLDQRPGDRSEMAFLEFVDYNWKASESAKAAEKSTSKKSGGKKAVGDNSKTQAKKSKKENSKEASA